MIDQYQLNAQQSQLPPPPTMAERNASPVKVQENFTNQATLDTEHTQDEQRGSPLAAGLPMTNMSASKSVSVSGRSPANIRINRDQMDEWSILARLQDFEAMKKKETEAAK